MSIGPKGFVLALLLSAANVFSATSAAGRATSPPPTVGRVRSLSVTGAGVLCLLCQSYTEGHVAAMPISAALGVCGSLISGTQKTPSFLARFHAVPLAQGYVAASIVRWAARIPLSNVTSEASRHLYRPACAATSFSRSRNSSSSTCVASLDTRGRPTATAAGTTQAGASRNFDSREGHPDVSRQPQRRRRPSQRDQLSRTAAQAEGSHPHVRHGWRPPRVCPGTRRGTRLASW